MSRIGTAVLATILAVTVSVPALARVGYTADIKQEIAQAEAWPEQIQIKHLDKVTKDLYLATAHIFFQGIKSTAEYWVQQPKPYPNMGFHVGNASWLALEYRRTGDEAYAQLAVKCLEHAHRLVVEPQEEPRNTAPGWLTIVDLYFIEKWLSNSPAYAGEQRKWVREICLRAAPRFPAEAVEYGAFNRAFHGAIAGEALLLLIPDAPGAAEWREFKEKVWNYWWQFRDNDESTDHYNALWFRYLLQWVEMRGLEKEFWADPGVKRMMERYLYQVFPMGAFPHYSDSTGWNVSWGHWIYIFESCATHYRDGRYKWAAHRLYDYGVNRIEKTTSWGYTGEEAGWSLLKAYLVADDTVAEQPREHEVATLMRHKITQRTEEERKATRQFFDLHSEMMPDKLIFCGGSNPDALTLMVDVADNAGHSHNRRPHLIALADHQSVLLMSLGYMERRPEDHNIPLLADYEGYPYDNTPYHLKSGNNLVGEVQALDLGVAGYGRIRIDNYLGYPATLTREIVFVKSAGVVVKDTLRMGLDLKVRWSPLYRARNVGPDFGDHWVNTYLGEWIPLRGLGNNAPVLTRWHNSPRDLLIYFLPDPEGKLELVDERDTDATLPLPLRVQYTLRQQLRANTPVAGTSLLLPHTPGPAAPLAGQVRVLLNEPERTVFEFADEKGVKYLIVLNSSGQPLKAGGLTTDAQVACIQHVGGKVQAVAMHGGKQLLFAGTDIAKQTPPARTNLVPAG